MIRHDRSNVFRDTKQRYLDSYDGILGSLTCMKRYWNTLVKCKLLKLSQGRVQGGAEAAYAPPKIVQVYIFQVYIGEIIK